MPRMISQALLLALTLGMAALLAAVWHLPIREAVLSGAAICLIALSLLIERRWPVEVGAALPKAEVAGDIGSFVLIFVLLDGALKWLTPFLVLAVLPGMTSWQAPLWQQVVVVTLWIELAAWASHWAHHHFGALWALHAMHHSPEQLYTLNNFRFHPLNHVLNHLAMILPPLLLGLSPDAILIYTALTLPVLLLQHSDAAFDFGALNLIFNTNTLHRWHHSAHPDEGMMNLGRALVLWDQVFGTYLNPPAEKSPQRLGLFEQSRNYPVATRIFAQLAWPFSARCCQKGA